MKYIEDTLEIFKDIMNSIDIYDVPLKYINTASYFDQYGNETVIDEHDIEKIIRKQFPYQSIDRKQISIILDLRQLAMDVRNDLIELFGHLDERMGK
jgi:hypothetical protein